MSGSWAAAGAPGAFVGGPTVTDTPACGGVAPAGPARPRGARPACGSSRCFKTLAPPRHA
eukprot:3193567-Prymnesium_polylepis.1